MYCESDGISTLSFQECTDTVPVDMPQPFQDEGDVHLVGLVVAGQRVHHEVGAEAVGQRPLPRAAGQSSVADLLERIAASGQGSFLAVLKTFGERAAPGLLSFARPGVM